MRRVIALVVLFSVAGTSAAAQAPAPVPDDPHPGVPFEAPSIPPGADNRVALHLGDRAPFEGVLFDPTTLVRWTNRILWLEQRLHLEHELHITAEDAARAAADRQLATVTASYERELQWTAGERNRLRADLAAAETRVARLERRPWYRSFGFGMGLGAGLVLTAGILGFTAGR